ncbi:MAG TPA: DUF3316 domain-containing protein [Prevotella sp.]|nr:DUF3316 domain-containing protein [Prevotella sp.]
MAKGTIRPFTRLVDCRRAANHMALALSLLLVSVAAKAQKEKASLISIGHVDILDTYLSQEKATGLELRYNKERLNRKFVGQSDSAGTGGMGMRKWSTFVSQEALLSKAGTRGNANSFLGAMYNLRFGWHYNMDRSTLNVRVGLLGDFMLGGIYNTRNSNNPAQLKLALSVDPSVMATWRFHVKGRPFALRYEASAPALGIAFSPNYGQSYYEIFTRGNYDHNVVFTSPASGFQIQQQLLFDFRLWRTTFTIGYLNDIRQLSANSLKYHQYTHAVTIGWRY